MNPRPTYTCAACRGTFEKGWTDDEALAEAHADFGADFTPTEDEIVCDNCYIEFTSLREAAALLEPTEFQKLVFNMVGQMIAREIIGEPGLSRLPPIKDL